MVNITVPWAPETEGRPTPAPNLRDLFERVWHSANVKVVTVFTWDEPSIIETMEQLQCSRIMSVPKARMKTDIDPRISISHRPPNSQPPCQPEEAGLAIWMRTKAGTSLPNHLAEALQGAMEAAYGLPDIIIGEAEHEQPVPWKIEFPPELGVPLGSTIPQVINSAPRSKFSLRNNVLNIFEPSVWSLLPVTTAVDQNIHPQITMHVDASASAGKVASAGVTHDNGTPAISAQKRDRDNNALELLAIVVAIHGAVRAGYDTITITSDSATAIAVFYHVFKGRVSETYWYQGELMYEALEVEKVLEYMETLDKIFFINLVKVESHFGTLGNESADRFAKLVGKTEGEADVEFSQISDLNLQALTPFNKKPYCLEEDNKTGKVCSICKDSRVVTHLRQGNMHQERLNHQSFYDDMESLLGHQHNPIFLSRHHCVPYNELPSRYQGLVIQLRTDVWPLAVPGNKIVSSMWNQQLVIPACPFCWEEGEEAISNLQHVLSCPKRDQLDITKLPWPTMCLRDKEQLMRKITPVVLCALTLGVFPTTLTPLPVATETMQKSLLGICRKLLEFVSRFAKGPSAIANSEDSDGDTEHQEVEEENEAGLEEAGSEDDQEGSMESREEANTVYPWSERVSEENWESQDEMPFGSEEDEEETYNT